MCKVFASGRAMCERYGSNSNKEYALTSGKCRASGGVEKPHQIHIQKMKKDVLLASELVQRGSLCVTGTDDTKYVYACAAKKTTFLHKTTHEKTRNGNSLNTHAHIHTDTDTREHEKYAFISISFYFH